MLEGYHFQNAYITRNIEKALETFRSRLGNGEEVRSFEIEQEIWTPKGKGKAKQKLAFVWVGNLQYELIEPVEGFVDVYADDLPDDDSMKFHHINMRVDDWDEFRAKVDREGWKIAIEGQSGDQLKFLYLDARDTLGHYLEYVWCSPERWEGLTAGMKK
ncbi:MAG TPA: VOC family protein [Sphingobium sp.]|uniref:VOC family protein n=1 Tax=Sphingobium sp. TaxID=1912891 RepID=UPI002ECFCCAE